MHLTPVSQRRLLRIRGRARAGSEKPISAKVRAYLDRQPIPRDALPSCAVRESEDERRRFDRVDLHSEVVVRRVGGFNFNVALRDLSTGGCRVELLEPSEVGDPVIARFPQLEPLGSRVCWTDGTTAGVQFLTTIHPAVFNLLLSRLPTAAPV